MKKKIGEIYNKPVVIGNKNEVTKNEVHVDELSSRAGSSGGSLKVRYFNVKPLIDMDLTQAVELLKVAPGLLAVRVIDATLPEIMPMTAINSELYNEITSAAILDNFRGFIEDTNDFNSSYLISQILQYGCTEITEEEFYNLNA